MHLLSKGVDGYEVDKEILLVTFCCFPLFCLSFSFTLLLELERKFHVLCLPSER